MSLSFQRLARSQAFVASLPTSRPTGRRCLTTATTNSSFTAAANSCRSRSHALFLHNRSKFSTSSSSSSSLSVLRRPAFSSWGNRGQKRMAQIGVAGLALGTAQYYLGSATDFFDETFVAATATNATPTDLADFYGTEDFMQVFCVFPFLVNLMMRNAEFDDDGTIHAFGLMGPGELQVSIDFDEREVDTNGDGQLDTLAWFNKKEHFQDTAPSWLGGFTLWEMTQNFGYHRGDDGTLVVYHHGEHFRGLFPIRLLFQLHAKYVIWATERYINSPAFGLKNEEEDEEEEDRITDELEEQRENIPLYVFKGFLAGLTRDIERVKEETPADAQEEQQALEATLRRLTTLRTTVDDTPPASLPRLRTLRSHKTKVAHVHLMVDDPETKDTIQTAVQQIGRSSKSWDGPSFEMSKLARRTTISSLQTRQEQ